MELLQKPCSKLGQYHATSLPFVKHVKMKLIMLVNFSLLLCLKTETVKSAWSYVTKRKQSRKCVPQFFFDGQRIQCVSKHTHPGHLISAMLDDNKRNSLCGKMNNVLYL